YAPKTRATLDPARRGVRAAEGARLEIAYVLEGASRVQIPPSPFSVGEPTRFPHVRNAGKPTRFPLLAGYGGDVLGDVLDLLWRQLAGELGHHALAVRDAVDHQRVGRLPVVEVRPDGAGRAGIRERVAARAAGGQEDLLAGRCIARLGRWS